MTTQQLLIKARALIEKNWGKGAYVRHNRDTGEATYCAIGALYTASCDSRISLPARRLLEKHLPPGHTGIIHYNDNYRTTKTDILQLFDTAIREAAQTRS